MKTYLYFIFFLICLVSCKEDVSKNVNLVENTEIIEESSEDYINKPFTHITIPFIERTINPQEEHVINFSNNTSISIQKNAFVDEKGNIITEDVTLNFRAFNDPLDFYLSGIPMKMSVNGNDYQLESENMFEINGISKGVPVFINADKTLKVTFKSNQNLKEYKIIKLEPKEENWAILEDSKYIKLKEEEIVELTSLKPVKPIKPVKLQAGRQTFSIELPNKDLYPELKDFKNVVYQIHESDTSYKASDAKILWDGFNLNKTNTSGVYAIEFYNREKKVNYLVQPAFDEANFENAMVTYKASLKKQKEEYENLKKQYQLREEKAQRERIKSGNINYNEEVLKTFSINDFGIFNSDRLFKTDGENIKINLQDEDGVSINGAFALVFHDVNSVYKCFTNTEFKLSTQKDISIWLVKDQSFYYVKTNSSELLKQKNNPVTLTKIKETFNSPEDLRRILKL